MLLGFDWIITRNNNSNWKYFFFFENLHYKMFNGPIFIIFIGPRIKALWPKNYNRNLKKFHWFWNEKTPGKQWTARPSNGQGHDIFFLFVYNQLRYVCVGLTFFELRGYWEISVPLLLWLVYSLVGYPHFLPKEDSCTYFLARGNI